MNKILLSSMALLAVFSSCAGGEEDLTPSGKADGYTIAQGDADYDKRIAAFYEKYGTCLLYQWTEKDAYWTPSGWENGALGKSDDGGKDGFIVYAPQKEYITRQLALLGNLWFGLYSDEALQKLLPRKVLLCSNVQETEVSYSWGESGFSMEYTGTDVAAHYNYDNISVSFASPLVEGLTAADSLQILKQLNMQFVESMIGRDMVAMPAQFSEVSDYTGASSLYNNSDLWARGIFGDSKSYSPRAEWDWKIMLKLMIYYPEDYLRHEPQAEWNEWTYDSDDTFDGILSATKDANGLINEKYDIARQYFIDNFGTDLQQVGNATARWR